MTRAAALVMLALAASGCAGVGGVPEPTPDQRLERARDVTELQPYWLGKRFLDTDVTGVNVILRRTARNRGTVIRYGKVAAVHTTDDLRARDVGGAVEPGTVRGVPVAVAPNSRYAVVATAGLTLLVEARDARTLDQALDALRPLDGARRDRLPAPTGPAIGDL